MSTFLRNLIGTHETAGAAAAAPAAANQPAAAPRELDDAVNSVAVDFVERAETTQEVTEVQVHDLDIGRKVHFEFSILHRGEKTPVEARLLEELALGCKRAVSAAYSRRLNELNQLRSATTPTRSQKQSLARAERELHIISKITSFTFKTDEKTNRHLLIITGQDPQSDKQATITLYLDPEFDGAAQAFNFHIERLKEQSANLNFKFQQLHHQLGNAQQEITNLRANIRPLENQRTYFTCLRVRTPEQEDQYTKVRESLAKEQEKLALLNAHIDRIELEIAELEETEEPLENLNLKAVALRDPELRQIRFQAVRSLDDDGEEYVYYVPVVDLFARAEDDDSIHKIDEIELTHPDYPILFYNGQVRAHKHVFEDITYAVESAKNSPTALAKTFVATIESIEQEHARKSNAARFTPEQIQQMRHYANEQRVAPVS